MGRSGWEKVLLSQPANDYMDPFGDGTSFYRRTSSGLELCSTPTCHVDALTCPSGHLVFDPGKQVADWADQADASYLLDADAPRPSRFGKV